MSDAVWLAIIASWTASWHDLADLIKSAFSSPQVMTFAGVVGVAVKQWWDARQAKKARLDAEKAQTAAAQAREEIKTKVDVLATVAIRSVDEIQNAKVAGVREGHVAGIEIGKLQSEFGPLRTNTIDITAKEP